MTALGKRRDLPLTDGWTLHLPADLTDVEAERIPADLIPPLQAGVPAQVPGCAGAAIVDAGLMTDPTTGDLEESARWWGWTRWEYRRQIHVAPQAEGARAEIAVDGLDTVAEIVWDGEVLATTRNMHRRYAVDVTDRATPGEHTLVLRFAAPEVEALAASGRLGGPLPNPYGRPYAMLRKAAYTFGWDWGPDFPSAGPWRAVTWREWAVELGDVRVSTMRRGDVWHLEANIDLRSCVDTPLTVRCHIAGAQASATVTPDGGTALAALTCDVTDPTLWLPRTLGEPHLHDLRVEVETDGTVVDTRTLRVGFREIDLVAEPDEAGRSFALRVNGREHYVRGLNWIPPTPFPGTATSTHVADLLDEMVALNADLIRVWGGGFYESDEFYNLCDERGLLVWQDFAFACAVYPEDAEIADEVLAEARDNVSRLAHHPSLAIWCGNNENHWAVQEWDDWAEQVADRPWGAGYYDDMLPRVVAELDPHRPYVPGSPWSGTPGVPVNADGHGCTHVWDVWNDVDHETYQDHAPRFVSEFGYQAPPAWSTMADCIGDEHLRPGDPVLESHQKAEDGEAKVTRGLRAHGGIPTDSDDWWWRCQQIQADAVRTGIEHFRALRGHCLGHVWWQLDDCWPVISWSVVDSVGVRKPAWFAMRRAHADRLLTVTGRRPRVVAVNETDEPWSGRVTVDVFDTSSGESTSQEYLLDVAPRAAHVIEPDVLGAPSDGRTVVRARTDAADVVSATWRDATVFDYLPAPRIEARARATGSVWEVEVLARTLALDVTLFPDRLAPTAQVDDGMITLWPGETHVFTVSALSDVHPTGSADALSRALTSRPVLRMTGDVQLSAPEDDPGVLATAADDGTRPAG